MSHHLSSAPFRLLGDLQPRPRAPFSSHFLKNAIAHDLTSPLLSWHLHFSVLRLIYGTCLLKTYTSVANEVAIVWGDPRGDRQNLESRRFHHWVKPNPHTPLTSGVSYHLSLGVYGLMITGVFECIQQVGWICDGLPLFSAMVYFKQSYCCAFIPHIRAYW